VTNISLALTAVAVPYSPTLKSISSSPQITVRVINNGNEELTLCWVDYSNATTSHGTVNAGNTWTVTTYRTHPWLIANPRDEIVGILSN
jgi:hypothetical protein